MQNSRTHLTNYMSTNKSQKAGYYIDLARLIQLSRGEHPPKRDRAHRHSHARFGIESGVGRTRQRPEETGACANRRREFHEQGAGRNRARTDCPRSRTGELGDFRSLRRRRETRHEAFDVTGAHAKARDSNCATRREPIVVVRRVRAQPRRAANGRRCPRLAAGNNGRRP